MTIRLTETVTKGGCAAKLPAGQLRQVLGQLALKNPPELVVGAETLDDACLWDLGNGQLLVQTLDFFTPIVDDPKDFGRIAAANALSDVFAMGGAPKTAMTILAFPSQKLDLNLLEPLMAGAVEKITEAGACLAGGHSIDDDTLKLGFSVSGFVPKEKAWKNSGAQAGDVLILTKALGTGTITSAIKNKKSKMEWEEAAIQSMCQLNRVPDLVSDFSVHAATDITGFGLLGHALQMAQASGHSIEFQSEALPVIVGARSCLEEKILNRAHRTNWEYVENQVQIDCKEEWKKWLAVDPQTSGGLLLSVSAADASEILKRVRSRFSHAAVIGSVKPEMTAGKRVVVI